MMGKATAKYNFRVCTPRLTKEWHHKKNGSLTPMDVKFSSNKKVWWQCSRGHEWEATVNNRNRGTGCPYCSGRKVNDENCLETVNPILAKEWHPTKNYNLTPKDVTAGSRKKVWWKCSRGHVWQACVNNRSNGHGCPYCSGRKVSYEKSLQTVNPTLAKEWHPTKNVKLTPKEVTIGSIKKIWWKCSRGHEWETTVNSRQHGHGCPYCSGRKVNDENCLETVNPILAKEWHPTKNYNLTPKEVTAGSGKKVWWKCSKGHVWEAHVYNRSKGTNCPFCSGHKAVNCLQKINPTLAK
jgi:hypothetical protein